MIEFVRGDTYPWKKDIHFIDGTPVPVNAIDTLFVTVRKKPQKQSPILFQKTLNDVTIDEQGYCHCVFNPEDTENLLYGPYYFDVEVTLKGGYRKSRLYQFNITKETSIHGGDINGN